jgi:signal transduction histidine kinase
VVQNGIAVRTQLADGLPRIQADRVQLQQVLLNLIVNAVQAMSGASDGARELLIATSADASNGILVSLRDSGPGLDPVSLERLFDAFYTTKSSGLGLGLSICRSIIEAHGGRIWAARMNLGARSFTSRSLWNGTRPRPPSTPAQCRKTQVAVELTVRSAP